MTFQEILMHCATDTELVTQFDRLQGSNLARKGAPINLMVDDATGKTNDDLQRFVEFVHECVYMPWLARMEAETTT